MKKLRTRVIYTRIKHDKGCKHRLPFQLYWFLHRNKIELTHAAESYTILPQNCKTRNTGGSVTFVHMDKKLGTFLYLSDLLNITVRITIRMKSCPPDINYNNEILPFCPEPKYPGATLDRLLTYRRHLQSLRRNLTSRVAFLRPLADSRWGAGATSLRTSNIVLVHTTAQYTVHSCLVPQCAHPPR